MSGSVIETEIEPAATAPPPAPPPRETGPVIEAGPATPDPAEAVAEAARLAKQKDQQIAAQRTRAERAEQAAAEARAAAQTAHTGRLNDHVVALTEAVNSSKSDMERHQQAWKVAREAGDIDAEIAAQSAYNQASFRNASATAELARVPRAPTQPDGTSGQPSQPTVSTKAQEWIKAHPEFKKEGDYRDYMMSKHYDAKRLHTEGTKEYFEFLDAADAEYHGQEPPAARGEGEGSRMNGRPRPSGAPPSRETGNGAAGRSTVQTMLGPITVRRLGDGRTALGFTSDEQRANFEEGAKITKMTLAAYTEDQVRIARERQGGSNAGLLVTRSDGV